MSHSAKAPCSCTRYTEWSLHQTVVAAAENEMYGPRKICPKTWQVNHQYSSSYHKEEMPSNKTDSKALGVQVFKFEKAKTQK